MNRDRPGSALATIAHHRDSAMALASSDAYYEQEAPRLTEAHDAVQNLVQRGRALQLRASRHNWSMFAEALDRVGGPRGEQR